jgi:hypothetical protein
VDQIRQRKGKDHTMMTKRHYVQVAKVIADATDLTDVHDPAHQNAKLWTAHHIGCNLASIFETDDPRFNREMFLKASNIDGPFYRS